MYGILIWDPIERILWGIAIVILIFGGIQYLRMGVIKKNQKERILIFGFAILFFSVVVYRIFAIIYETITPGIYINNGFYGDYEQINPILREVILKSAYISILTGFALFSYTVESYLKKTKYTITSIYVFFIIAIIILPFNLAMFVENYIVSTINVIFLIFFLFYFTKYSRIEFKSISSLLLLGVLLIFMGFALTDDGIQQYNIIPIFLAPCLVIIGGIIAISPTILNPKYFSLSLVYWKIIGLIIFGGFCIGLLINIYFKALLFIIIESFILLLIFSYLYYNQYKTIKSELFFNDLENHKRDVPNILGLFAKPDKIFRLIAENANDLIEIFDEDFNIEYINENIHRNILGYSREDLLGLNRGDFIHPDDISNMMQKQKEFILNKEIIGEVRFKKKDGTYVWLEYRGKAYKSINYDIKYLLISRDITAHKEYVMRLNEIDELRKDFIMRATHDLKNPMTSIYAISEMIYDIIEKIPENYKNILPEKLFTLYNHLYNDIGRMTKLANNLLDLSTIEGGSIKLNKENINLTKIINDCIEGEKFLSHTRNISICNSLPQTLHINADKTKMTQIFQNLISNALKNTPINGKINISSKKNNSHIKFFVKDTGIGLLPVEIEQLFTKFCKVERNENTIISEGFGCGLYITKQIALSHGGNIWVESEGRKKGATFIIELPLTK